MPGYQQRYKVDIEWIDSEQITEENVKDKLNNVDGIIIPGGFGVSWY